MIKNNIVVFIFLIILIIFGIFNSSNSNKTIVEKKIDISNSQKPKLTNTNNSDIEFIGNNETQDLIKDDSFELVESYNFNIGAEQYFDEVDNFIEYI